MIEKTGKPYNFVAMEDDLSYVVLTYSEGENTIELNCTGKEMAHMLCAMVDVFAQKLIETGSSAQEAFEGISDLIEVVARNRCSEDFLKNVLVARES